MAKFVKILDNVYIGGAIINSEEIIKHNIQVIINLTDVQRENISNIQVKIDTEKLNMLEHGGNVNNFLHATEVALSILNINKKIFIQDYRGLFLSPVIAVLLHSTVNKCSTEESIGVISELLYDNLYYSVLLDCL